MDNVQVISQKEGNKVCADCKRADWDDLKQDKKKKFGKKKGSVLEIPEYVTTYVSRTFGVFLCSDCADSHKLLENNPSDVVEVANFLNDIELAQLCVDNGNDKVNDELEFRVPGYVIRPDTQTVENLAPIRFDYINRKYVEKAFTDANKDAFNLKMPEFSVETEAFLNKGKRSWDRLFLMHHHCWIMIYNSDIDSEISSLIPVKDVTECSVHNFKTKDDQKLFCLKLTYTKMKDGKSKEKTLIINLMSVQKLTIFVSSIRKAMIFYQDEVNHPKTFTNPKINPVSNRLTTNITSKGQMFMRSGRNSWKSRFVTIVGPALYIFKKEGETMPEEIVPLYNAEIKRRMNIVKERKFSLVMVCQEKTYFFALETSKEMENWIQLLRDKTRDHPIRRRFDFINNSGNKKA